MSNIRDMLKNFYAGYDVYIRPVLKFALALATFLIINNKLGYLSILNSMFVLIILSLVCAILPMNAIVIFGVVLIIGHCFGLSMEVGLFAAVFYLLMALLYFRFVPGDALVVVLTPVSFLIQAPLAVPLSLGLVGTPVSLISSAFGVLSWQFIDHVDKEIAPMVTSGDAGMLELIQKIPSGVFSKETILLVITFMVVILAACTVRKLMFSYAETIAVAVGAVLYLILIIVGSLVLEVGINLLMVVIGTVISVAIGLVLNYFLYSVDYMSTEYVQFEDDRYRYYVKIVPKTGRPVEIPGEEAVQETRVPHTYGRKQKAQDAAGRKALSGRGAAESVGSARTGKNPKPEKQNTEKAVTAQKTTVLPNLQLNMPVSGEKKAEEKADFSAALEKSLRNLNTNTQERQRKE